MRVKKVLRTVLGLCRAVVIVASELQERGEGTRPGLVVQIRTRAGHKGRCGRCGTRSPWFDRGEGERRWRHVDVGYATCELVADAPRVACPDHGPTVADYAVLGYPLKRTDHKIVWLQATAATNGRGHRCPTHVRAG